MPPSLNKAFANYRYGRRGPGAAAKRWDISAFGELHTQITAEDKSEIRLVQGHQDKSRAAYGEGITMISAMAKENPGLLYHVDYFLQLKTAKIRDIFNYEKLLSDFLTRCGVLLDDYFIDFAVMRRHTGDYPRDQIAIAVGRLGGFQ